MTSVSRILIYGVLALLAACATPRKDAVTPAPTVRFDAVSWSKLPGWRADDSLAAWPALVNSCNAIHARPEWSSFCAAVVAASPGDADFSRDFIEQQLTPYRITRVTDHPQFPMIVLVVEPED